MTCALLGLTLVLFVIGVDQLIRATSGVPDELTARVAGARASPRPGDRGQRGTEPAALPRRRPRRRLLRPRPRMAWTEPSDPVLPSVPETSYGPEVEARFVPDWVREEVPGRLDGPFVTVRRVPAPDDPDAVPTLRRAFDVKGGTVEIADDGPFVEDDLRIAGESRLIRARAGYRPIVRVEEPKIDFLKGRGLTAVFILDGKRLILDGLDLIVNVPDLPLDRTALFLCKGADLTLRNCTITVLNPAGRPFTLFRTAPPDAPSDRASRIRLERDLRARDVPVGVRPLRRPGRGRRHAIGADPGRRPADRMPAGRHDRRAADPPDPQPARVPGADPRDRRLGDDRPARFGGRPRPRDDVRPDRRGEPVEPDRLA